MDTDVTFPLTRPASMTALEWTDWLERCNHFYKRDMLDQLGLRWMAEDMAEGRASNYGIQVRNERLYKAALLTAGDYAIELLWAKTRVVYDVDPTLQASLTDMQTGNVLPGDVLRQLPHPNPLFIWPHGHETTANGGKKAVVWAMHVTGRTAGKHLCSTHDEDVDAYQLTFISDIYDDQGQVETTDSVRLSFDLRPKATSIDEIVKTVLRNFTWEPLLPDGGTHEQKVAYMTDLARFGVAHLLYTCSERADVAPTPKASRTIAKGKNKGKPTPGASLAYPLGYRIGPAIRSARERFEREGRSAATGGRTVTPHIRRAHLHTFRHGPGRALSKVKWLPPLFIGANGEEYAAQTTVIPVES